MIWHSVLASLCLLPLAMKAQTTECPFVPSSCPVTLDNVFDVFYFDVNDMYSCQRECDEINDCNYFTMRPQGPFMECYLFKHCDYYEPCPECITGTPEVPIENCVGNTTTCETSLDNIIDVDFYDDQDTFSCPYQCQITPNCNYWTQYDDTTKEPVQHKCFLFVECSVSELCPVECETGPKPTS